MPHHHPKPGERGEPVVLRAPSRPSALSAWADPDAPAAVVPSGPMPPALHGVPIQRWQGAPGTLEGWEALAALRPVDESAFARPPGYKAAAGVVVVEPDDRFWLVSPSNGFAGYATTFPKGTVDAGAGLQATAIKEAFEESGLRVELSAFLVDVRRSSSYTRYYYARRVGGDPSDMGWESQCVRLVPRRQLAGVLTHANDAKVLAAILASQGSAAAGPVGGAGRHRVARTADR